MSFKRDDEIVWLHDGQEIPGRVISFGTSYGQSEPTIYEIEVDGQKRHVKPSELLEPKKPGFEVRDLAYVLDEGRDAIQGEVVAIGVGPNKRHFYQLKFEPAIGHGQSWYREDEVFKVSVPNEDAEVGGFFA